MPASSGDSWNLFLFLEWPTVEKVNIGHRHCKQVLKMEIITHVLLKQATISVSRWPILYSPSHCVSSLKKDTCLSPIVHLSRATNSVVTTWAHVLIAKDLNYVWTLNWKVPQTWRMKGSMPWSDTECLLRCQVLSMQDMQLLGLFFSLVRSLWNK